MYITYGDLAYQLSDKIKELIELHNMLVENELRQEATEEDKNKIDKALGIK